jgi:hypothetical protein
MQVRKDVIMHKKILMAFIVAGLFLITISCKKGKSKVELPSLGFSMNLPANWQTDPDNVYYFYDKTNSENNFGFIVISPSNGRTLDEAVDSISAQTEKLESMFKSAARILDNFVPGDQSQAFDKLPQSQILSRKSFAINKLPAVEVISEADCSIYHTYIAKDDSIIEITFRTATEDFPDKLESFRKAVASVKIE